MLVSGVVNRSLHITLLRKKMKAEALEHPVGQTTHYDMSKLTVTWLPLTCKAGEATGMLVTQPPINQVSQKQQRHLQSRLR